MLRKKISVLLLLLFCLSIQFINGQERQKEKTKKGWTFGFFPAFGYDPNVGAKYGGYLNLYDYGDGTNYPKYNQYLHFEWSRTTKGQATRQLTFDTRTLIPRIRLMAEATYITDKVFSFYGVNGYNSYYNSAFTSKSSPLYRSSVFYGNQRALTKVKLELMGKLKVNSLKWFCGFEYMNTRLDTVDIGNLNKGRDPGKYLPSVGGGLYGNYIRWGLIPHEQADGGQTGIFKIGAIYDTRNADTNPMKGLWTEMQLLLSPGFLSDGFNYARIDLTHRQFITIIPELLNFAYRVSWQGKIVGKMPVYMLPLAYNSAPQVTVSGLGGNSTIRGVLRNRIAGEDFAYWNAELRWKVFRTVIFNQNIYLCLIGFTDGGMVTGKYRLPEITDPEGLAWLAMGGEERPHISYGTGAYLVINGNFAIKSDFGWAVDKRDGSRGTYIGIGYLF
jgi:hypothetical protein